MIALLNTAERVNISHQIDNYVFQRHVFAYKEAIKHLKGIVIELGCGTGYGLDILAPNCVWVAGVDKYISSQKYSHSNCGIFRSKLPNLNNIGNDSFDTVICFQVIEHIKEDNILIAEIRRILRPGGKLILTTPNNLMSLTRNPHHVREYSTKTIQKILTGVLINTNYWEYMEIIMLCNIMKQIK
ncbi:class I SAM-dependent methyltransferase [Dyadobacter aurulentus]|uniref:class I SAM-dependent methyltransferase n=1 Tax=Dyadobacter sp. UC 10 TaxID=2605428 RepID=UPI001788D4C6|nr:class I SAM-dependent methyltransferase [Dyadobacter sp. UC 10]